MSDILIRSINLSKNYGKIKALKEASFSIKRGTITAFLGENGAGKTTTIKILLGFLKPDSGRVEINCLKLGYVPDRPLFSPGLKERRFWKLQPDFLELMGRGSTT